MGIALHSTNGKFNYLWIVYWRFCCCWWWWAIFFLHLNWIPNIHLLALPPLATRHHPIFLIDDECKHFVLTVIIIYHMQTDADYENSFKLNSEMSVLGPNFNIVNDIKFDKKTGAFCHIKWFQIWIYIWCTHQFNTIISFGIYNINLVHVQETQCKWNTQNSNPHQFAWTEFGKFLVYY